MDGTTIGIIILAIFVAGIIIFLATRKKVGQSPGKGSHPVKPKKPINEITEPKK